MLFSPDGGPLRNARVFADAKEQINRLYNTILFVKTGQWCFHHRDGMNHQEGDVIKYFDWLDVAITSDIVLNVTKYIVDDPKDQFTTCEFNGIDINNNGSDDITQKYYTQAKKGKIRFNIHCKVC